MKKKLFVLGPRGTFSSMTAEKLNTLGEFDEQFLSTIPDVFHEVENDPDALGVVPVENMSTGNIGVTLEFLQTSGIELVGELTIPIQFVLIHTGELANLKKLYAFSETYQQCIRFIFSHFSAPERIATNSNIDSFDKFAADPHKENAGAIIPLPFFRNQALDKLYRFQVNIENDTQNATRFIVIKKADEAGVVPDFLKAKTSLFVDALEDRPSFLFNILKAFDREQINLSMLHSKPSKKQRGNYGFFIDFFNAQPLSSMRCLDELRNKNIECKLLGTYNEIN